MRLKKLELYGFKSFAQRTEIAFNEGITGIVGPNGSGKSNIADAVRWVLGEQSARTLRGSSMQDVIFGGTQKRKPMSYCEVSLIFDNEDRALPIDYAEVAVTRRVYRSGESEYFLNRAGCRLRDVVDLFRDTGIGKEGYSIIGQGRIDEILSRKGEDRRQVFEEAAGIVKFRARKEEADRKLARTLENASRADNILEEISRQLSPLEIQAKNARIYLEKAAELKELDMNLFLARSDRLQAKLRETDEQLRAMRMVLEDTEAQIREKGAGRDALQAEISALDGRISEAHGAQIAGMEAAHAAQEALGSLQERRRNRAENRQRMEEELAAQTAREAELEQLRAENEGQSEQGAQLLETREKELEAARLEEAAARAAEEKLEQDLEDRKAALIEQINRRAAAENDQTRLKTMLDAMESRLAEVTRTWEEMRETRVRLEDAAEEARRLLKAEEALEEEKRGELAQAREALSQAEREAAARQETYEARLAALRDMESRRRILEEMSREMEGYSHPVRSVMKRAEERGDTRVRGPVSRLIRVPARYETALDMALGAAQQHIVTEDEETARDMIRFLRERKLGRATFLPMSAVKGRGLTPAEREALRLPGCLGVASELVECDPEYREIVENLLGRTVAADTLEHGIAIMRRAHHAFRLVTLDGDVMHSGGSMTGGSVSGRTLNLFTRERELKELTEQMAAGQDALETLLREIAADREARGGLEKAAEEALEALHQQEIAVARETERTENARGDLQMHGMRLTETEAAREQLMESMLQIREQLSMIRPEEGADAWSRETAEAEIAEGQRALQAARTETERLAAETLRRTLEHSGLQHEWETLQRDRSRFRAEQERMAREQETRREALRQAEKADAEDARLEAERTAALETAKLEQARRDRITAALEEERGRKQESLRELLQALEGLHETLQRDTDRTHRAELGRARTENDLKALQDRIWNTYEVTYAGAEEYRRKEPFSLTEADRQAAQLSTEIRALGPVNVQAVEEYAATKARYDELSGQREDLRQAEKDLRTLIDRLLKEMESVFTEQFGLLQGYFSETFTRLFGGGHAELSLTNPSDPLNCGIEINAQPPGKKLQLLSLLSGGERALTAIAILFATLKLKPTPFCILDEIEAALDDANIGYFADYLAEYAKGTQFVVITHRKGTMERADGLYGVAMEEQGVSRMVSVSLQDYRD